MAHILKKELGNWQKLNEVLDRLLIGGQEMKTKEYYEQWEKKKMREKIQELTQQTNDQQRLLRRLISYIEKQSGGVHIVNGFFKRDSYMSDFTIMEDGLVSQHNDFTLGG